jgi:nitrate reductase gamma subunit
MNVLIALGAVLALVALSYLGAIAGAQALFGIWLPYLAVSVFLIGVILRILAWAKIPVPFKIPTTCGQGKSLPWVKNAPIESPDTKLGVIVRMALEVFLFRSLFRNTRMELRKGPKLSYGSNEWLWLAGLVFHYSFLVIFLRHFRLFLQPVPEWVNGLAGLDGFLQIGVPVLYLTDVLVVAAVTFLFVRRVWSPTLRYLSLVNDYFPLFLILGIALSGITLRYWTKVDVVEVKSLVVALVSFNMVALNEVSSNIHAMFFVHLCLVCVLLAYFPFSKLMHLGGVFMSPTRNMPNDNRMRRHVNPWNPKVKVHTYEEWEDDFRKKMKAAGLPVDKDEPQES